MECEERNEKHIEALPMSLYEAIIELEKSDIIKDALGSHVTDKFITAKLKEWNEYRKAVHDWEVEEYLRTY